MSYTINLSKTVIKELKKINKPYIDNITEAIDDLQQKGLSSSNIKALKGKLKDYYHKGLGRKDVSVYRIIFLADHKNKIIYVITIGHRKDIYK